KPFQIDSIILNGDTFITKEHTLNNAGFLRCIATVVIDGKEYRNLGTAGIAPWKINPTVSMPSDFNEFWQNAKDELAKVSLDTKMTLIPERCSALSNAYLVNIQGIANSRIYGMLAIPKKPGKYPAVLQVPGAGIRPYAPDLELADKGVIVLTIGIHGIPVNLEPEVYNHLNTGALNGYFYFNMQDRNKYYYKRVYTNVVRANDFLVSLPEYDGSTLAVTGGSQGGALSIVTASLDKRVKYLMAYYPAMCDLVGYLNGRAGGWPHTFSSDHPMSLPWKELAQNSTTSLSYYDVVNFAKSVFIEGLYSWGFNDETCPPTSIYAAYNSIPGLKQTLIYHDTGHWAYPEQRQKAQQWLLSKIKSGLPK
ncbi:MAG: acetylxylan esterase, partial [Chitinophagaceae bacterium]